MIIHAVCGVGLGVALIDGSPWWGYGRGKALVKVACLWRVPSGMTNTLKVFRKDSASFNVKCFRCVYRVYVPCHCSPLVFNLILIRIINLMRFPFNLYTLICLDFFPPSALPIHIPVQLSESRGSWQLNEKTVFQELMDYLKCYENMSDRVPMHGITTQHNSFKHWHKEEIFDNPVFLCIIFPRSLNGVCH